MERKNTMLLTVIAVATLLVAVVGATFAYYSISTTNDNNTTVVNTQTAKVGSVALTNPTPNLYLSLSAADMAKDNQGAYYATTTANPAVGVSNYQMDGENKATHPTSSIIARITADGGETDAVYSCKSSMRVVVAGNMVQHLVTGDAQIVFSKTAGVTTFTPTTVDVVSGTAAGTGDEKTFTYEYPVQYQTTGNTTQTISAYVQFNNTSVDQSALANKTFTITFSNPTFTCVSGTTYPE